MPELLVGGGLGRRTGAADWAASRDRPMPRAESDASRPVCMCGPALCALTAQLESR
jgi:hypothetical protein